MQHQEIKEVFIVIDLRSRAIQEVFSSETRAKEWMSCNCNYKHHPQGFTIVTRELDKDF